jgi:hypothetical protein
LHGTGQAAQDAEVLQSRPGNRIRLRIINSAGDTAYRVGVVTDGGRLKADESVLLTATKPDRLHTMRLTGSMAKYD